MKNWKDVALKVKAELGNDHVSIVAAGMAFSLMLSLFPAMIALVSLYGLLFDPHDVQSQVGSLSEMLPDSAREVLSTQMSALVESPRTALGFGLGVAIAGALWTASAGMSSAMESMNIAFDVEERRSFVKRKLLAVLLTVGALVVMATSFAIAAVLPSVFDSLGFAGAGRTLVLIGRWPVMAIIVAFGLAVLYRFAPCRDQARWRWITVGAATATLLWLGATWLLSFYVSSLGRYQETYGTLGGGIVLMLWLYVSSFVVLLGAEIDAVLESRSRATRVSDEDESFGPGHPLGVPTLRAR